MNQEDIYSILKKNPLFANINEKVFQLLFEQMQEIHLQPNNYLIHEDEPSENFYIVMEGSLDVSKKDGNKKEHSISTLGAGDTIGEMAIFDKASRSASVRAHTKATVIRINFDTISDLIEKKPALSTIFMSIGKEISSRLRYTNEVTVKALEQQLYEFKMRISMANFMVSIILFLMFYIFVEIKLSSILLTTTQSTSVAVPILLVLILFIIVMIKTSSISFSMCGITSHNWKKSLYESVLFTCPILILLTILKWLGMKYHFPYAYFGTGLFDPYAGFHALPEQVIFRAWAENLALYCLFSAPLQELITRGALQTSLETFLIGKHKTWEAIIISNAIFSSFHVAVSMYLAIIVFIPGLFFGWLFSRHHTLIGVWVSHAMIGAWVFWILGVWIQH